LCRTTDQMQADSTVFKEILQIESVALVADF
jgi:hypothetical protein